LSTSARYTLRLRDIVIGWSDLERRDRGTGVARGAFRPGLGWDLVEPIFVLRPTDPSAADAAEREQRYRRARDTLSLSLHTADGTMLDTARIDVMRDEGSATDLALEVVIVDQTFWKRDADTKGGAGP
jgi:hypothetical protein